MGESAKLEDKLKAYYLFLKNYDQAAIATAAGVSTRTIRNWIRDEEWDKDLRVLQGLVRGVVLAELVTDFRKFRGEVEGTTGARAGSRPVTMKDVRARQEKPACAVPGTADRGEGHGD